VEENGCRTWYKAIGDGKIRNLHWTCVMDTNLDSHNMAHVGVASKGWHLFDDMRTLSTHMRYGWEESDTSRFMTIYIRAEGEHASRGFTPTEQMNEERRDKELDKLFGGARVAGWKIPVIHAMDVLPRREILSCMP